MTRGDAISLTVLLRSPSFFTTSISSLPFGFAEIFAATMAALSNPFVISKTHDALRLSSGSSLKSGDQCADHNYLAFSLKGTSKSLSQKRMLAVQASYSVGGKQSGASAFVGGFVLGGLIVGTLGCVYAPQISKALTGTDKKDLMKKLPKFIYDEEKALEKQRKKLAEKIEQLNSAIDNVSNQLQSDEPPNGSVVSSDNIEAIL